MKQVLLMLGLLMSLPALAKVSPEEAAKLGTSLTPMGAEKAGNQAGTIPAWDGGLPRKDYARGANPYADDKPLYVISNANLKQYSKLLTEGQKMLFKTFPEYTMPVYPTRRSASYPEWFLEARSESTRLNSSHNPASRMPSSA
jgi:hypothetical protein